MRIILIVIILLFAVFTIAAEHDCGAETGSDSSSAPASPPEPTAVPEPTATPESKFNCRDLELEYLNMSDLGYEFALMHVSNVMTLQDGNPLAYYTSGDAERELQNCGVIPR